MASKLIFTSGTQAIQGRTVNHDPQPYSYFDGLRLSQPLHRTIGMPDNNPRPEYAVTDNPILAAFRKDPDPEQLSTWLFGMAQLGEDGGYYGITPVSPAQVEHAKRVITRLAKLVS